MSKKFLLILVVAVCASLTRTAAAHPLNIANLQLEVEANGTVALRLDMAAQTTAELAADKLLASLALTSGTNCDPPARVHGDATSASADVHCPSPITSLHVTLHALDAAPLGFQIIGKAVREGEEQVFNLDLEHTAADIRWDSAPSFERFLMMGVRHIGAWPSEWFSLGRLHLAAGIDHILFLLALLLGGGDLKRTLTMVTGFTLGHSITLALATFGIAHAPSHLVEPAIALSIIYVAIEDFLRPAPQHRWQVATFFGLVHGLAFASALADVHLQRGDMVTALVGFNVGVELGQAAIVLALTSVFLAFNRLAHPTPQTKRRAVQMLAVFILIPATYWFIERAFLS